MSSMRPFLYLALAVASFFLWQRWETFLHPVPDVAVAPMERPADQTLTETSGDDESLVPAAADAPEARASERAPEKSVSIAPATTGETIQVTTDVLSLTISTRGGEIVAAQLLDYPVTLKHPEIKVSLYSQDPETLYSAQSGLVSKGQAAPSHQALYHADKTRYEMSPGMDRLEIPLHWQEGGVRVEKRYVLTRGSYLIDVTHHVENDADATWLGNQYAQLQRVQPPEPKGSSFTNPGRYSYFGGAFYNPEEGFEKVKFKDLDEQAAREDIQAGWLAMVQHYFFSAWIPDQDALYHFQGLRSGGSKPSYLLRFSGPALSVEPGNAGDFHARLYVGPKQQEVLPDIAPGLELTVDYGIFTVLSKPLFWLLRTLHKLLGNWGWSIIFVTVAIKAAFFKLSEAQYRSMARMRKLQPRITSLRERFADDKQKLNEAMMGLYKTEKVNPLGGCLPVVVQIPVFISLYWVLLESVELRQAPFFLWLQDLSSPDPYYILPIIMGLSTVVQQKLSPSPGTDPVQQKVMMLLPVLMSVMFAFFQSGLVLYWTVNSLLGLAQQWAITRRMEAAK